MGETVLLIVRQQIHAQITWRLIESGAYLSLQDRAMKKLFNDVGDTLNKVLYGLPKGLSPDESLRLVVATSRDAADAAVNRMLGVKS